VAVTATAFVGAEPGAQEFTGAQVNPLNHVPRGQLRVQNALPPFEFSPDGHAAQSELCVAPCFIGAKLGAQAVTLAHGALPPAENLGARHTAHPSLANFAPLGLVGAVPGAHCMAEQAAAAAVENVPFEHAAHVVAAPPAEDVPAGHTAQPSVALFAPT
jgi:hypothetical protein